MTTTISVEPADGRIPPMTPEAQQGIYRYNGTDGAQHTINLLQVAGSQGYTSTIDPTISGILGQVNSTQAKSSGLICTQRQRPDAGRSNAIPVPTAQVEAISRIALIAAIALSTATIGYTQDPKPTESSSP